MKNRIKKWPNPLAILTVASLSLLGSQMPNVAMADQWNPSLNQTNEFLLAQQVCQVNSPQDPRGVVDIRDASKSKNIGFFNNGTSVTVQRFDGEWAQVIGPNNAQGFVYTPYLQNCNTAPNPQPPTTGNATRIVPVGTICQAVGSPQYPNIPVQDYPNAKSNRMAYAFDKGTQLRVLQPPAGQQSQSKWVYVQSIPNPQLVGWVWTPYLQCN